MDTPTPSPDDGLAAEISERRRADQRACSTSFALTELTAAEEAKIRAIVKKAAS